MIKDGVETFKSPSFDHSKDEVEAVVSAHIQTSLKSSIEIPFVFNYCAQNRIFFKVQQEDKRLVSMKDMSLGSHVNIVIVFLINIMEH